MHYAHVLLITEKVRAYLTQKLGEVFIIDFNSAWSWCLEADLFVVTSCEHKVTIIWLHTRPAESNHQNDIKNRLCV